MTIYFYDRENTHLAHFDTQVSVPRKGDWIVFETDSKPSARLVVDVEWRYSTGGPFIKVILA